MKPQKVYLSLGSNLGERSQNLRNAIAALREAGVRVVRESPLYETEPVDYLEQPWFLNSVVEVETEESPLNLLRILRGIESSMGSKKLLPKGPRLIDMDILLYGDETMETPELQIPHPRMTQRRFVLAPLEELAPELRNPSWNGTVRELLAALKDRSLVRRVS